MDRKKYLMLIIGAMLAVILIPGCRAAVDQNSIENTNPMEEALTFAISTEVQKEEHTVVSELLGGEEEQEKEILADADIYNQPSLLASQLGEVKEGDVLPVFGICEDADWYKVVYNGRVAYIRTEAVAAGEESSEEGNNLSQGIQNHQSSNNQGAAGTRRPVGLPSTTEDRSASDVSSVTEGESATETEASTEGIPSTEDSSTTEGSTTTEMPPTTEDSSTTEASPIIDIPPTTEAEQME